MDHTMNRPTAGASHDVVAVRSGKPAAHGGFGVLTGPEAAASMQAPDVELAPGCIPGDAQI